MPKKNTTPKGTLSRWADFFSTYWHLLDSDQRTSYLAMLDAGQNPPTSMDIEELPGMEQKLLMKHMGSVIKKYRENKGIEQQEFAVMMGKKSSHISLIESGDKMFTAVDLARSSKMLNIPHSELLCITE